MDLAELHAIKTVEYQACVMVRQEVEDDFRVGEGDKIIEQARVNRANRLCEQSKQALDTIEALQRIIESNKKGYLQIYLPESETSIRYTWGGFGERDELASILNPATVDQAFSQW